MNPVLVITLIAAALLLAAAGFVQTVRRRLPGGVIRAAAWTLWMVTAAQAAITLIALRGGVEVEEPVTFIGYLIAVVVVLPFGLRVAAAEASRWSGAVIAVCGLATAAMLARLQFLWVAAGV